MHTLISMVSCLQPDKTGREDTWEKDFYRAYEWKLKPVKSGIHIYQQTHQTVHKF
jgi:hypothetical protein